MKKKISFSLLNYFEPVGYEVNGLQTKFKAFTGMLCGFSYIASNEKYTLVAMAICFIINELIGCIKIEITNE